MIATANAIDVFSDFEAYAGAAWQVQPKVGKPIPFLQTASQRIVQFEINRMHAQGVQVSVKALKARQQGISTFCTGYCQHGCQTNYGHNAISIADKMQLPGQWLQRAKRWHAQTPSELRPSLAKSNATEMYFDGLDSRYSIGSQLGQTPGMGMTLTDIHCSELSNWRNPTKVMDDLNPSMPSDNPDVAVLWESTGEMVGDWWYDEIMLTLDGGDSFKVIFLPWFITEEYGRPPVGVPIDIGPADYTDEEQQFVAIAEAWARNNPEHAYIANFAGITPGHMIWRRWTIANKFSGDIERFKSKYPATVDEAFLSVGSLAIPLEIILHHQTQIKVPLRHVQFRRTTDGTVVAEDCPPVGPHWEICEEPTEYCEYTVGGDPAEGKLSDTGDERSDRDYSDASVMDRRKLRFVAEFHGQIAPDLFGQEMKMAGTYYGMAYMGGEVNNNGWATVTECKDYPNMLYRDGGTPDDVDERDITKLWFYTSPGAGGTRNQLINTWIAGCRRDNEGWHNAIEICSERLVREEKTFIIKANGKREHRDGCWDDTVFSHMLAYWTHLNTPHVRRDAMTHLRTNRKPRGRPGYAYAGGVDDCEDV